LPNQDIKVGLLAYGAIGDEHSRAIAAAAHLTLAAVCDTNPERIAAALSISPAAQTFTDANRMLNEADLDLVIISTPPNSHFDWAHKALTRGLHVILEKPMALTAAQCDELMALASAQNLLLVVYQNRRYDQDFLTIKELVESDQIGQIFSYESFVGGYSKPCNFWHSMADVSGGAIFDWGSHFIDQIMALIPAPVETVTGLNQKLVWDHVTNADHAQVAINFAGNVQATFINSDLAAARKPKFYILGTKGAIVGDWDTSGDGAVADLPALISLHKDGTVTKVALKERPAISFHASVGEFLQNGTAMAITAMQSRDVVAIMQAAEESALIKGAPIQPALISR
jgi:scyllo-inositol 2-dehydrogenase (NADP+)